MSDLTPDRELCALVDPTSIVGPVGIPAPCDLAEQLQGARSVLRGIVSAFDESLETLSRQIDSDPPTTLEDPLLLDGQDVGVTVGGALLIMLQQSVALAKTCLPEHQGES